MFGVYDGSATAIHSFEKHQLGGKELCMEYTAIPRMPKTQWIHLLSVYLLLFKITLSFILLFARTTKASGLYRRYSHIFFVGISGYFPSEKFFSLVRTIGFFSSCHVNESDAM